MDHDTGYRPLLTLLKYRVLHTPFLVNVLIGELKPLADLILQARDETP